MLRTTPRAGQNSAVTTEVYQIPFAVDLAAVGIGAIQGAMFAAQIPNRRIDMFGVALIGIFTGFGGGIIRGLLLAQIPMALQNNWYLIVATAAALLGMALQGIFHRLNLVILVLDAITIGLFGALGTTAALAAGLPALPAVFVGVASAVGGGMLRDLFLNQPVAVMHVGSLYAVAAAVGCSALIVFVKWGMDVGVAGTLCMLITVIIRLLSVRFKLSVPEQQSLTGAIRAIKKRQ